MQEYQTIENWEELTIVSTYGELIWAPSNPQGLIIVDQKDNKEVPVLGITDVSDDDMVNLLIETPGGRRMSVGDATSSELLFSRNKLGLPLE